MNLTFYAITDDYRKVNKALGEGVALNIDVRTDVDVYSPTFQIKNFDRKYNYLLWNGKYYFITGTGYIGKNVWRIETDIDVLMSYKDIILNGDCRINQSTNTQAFYNGGDYPYLETFEKDIYKSDVTLSDTMQNVLISINGV